MNGARHGRSRGREKNVLLENGNDVAFSEPMVEIAHKYVGRVGVLVVPRGLQTQCRLSLINALDLLCNVHFLPPGASTVRYRLCCAVVWTRKRQEKCGKKKIEKEITIYKLVLVSGAWVKWAVVRWLGRVAHALLLLLLLLLGLLLVVLLLLALMILLLCTLVLLCVVHHAISKCKE
jgi:hypothetical protein